jgi:hypothetical protein
MWTATEIVKGDRIVLYNFGEQRVCVVCGSVVFIVTVWRRVSLLWLVLRVLMGTAVCCKIVGKRECVW